MCETVCQCVQDVCKVQGLKMCPICDTVLKSQCSKTMCKIVANGKPKMVIPAFDRNKTACKDLKKSSAKKSGQVLKRTVYELIYSSESEKSDRSGDETSDSSQQGEDDVESFLKEVWESISPPIKEDDIVGKWFCADYQGTLIIGRAKKRWLDDEGGNVQSLRLDCLKPHTGSGCTLQSYPAGQEDIFDFNLEDIIGGPLTCHIPPRKPGSWQFPDWEKVNTYYRELNQVDRAALCKKLIKGSNPTE